MSDKIKVWKCDECTLGDKPCYCGWTKYPEDVIKCCNQSLQRWQESADFEIVRKRTGFGKDGIPVGMIPGKHYFCEAIETAEGNIIKYAEIEKGVKTGFVFDGFLITKKEKYHGYIASGMKKQTPNCATCRWKEKMLSVKHGSEKPDMVYVYCSAQGANEINDVYNSDNCKVLFEVEEIKNANDCFKKIPSGSHTNWDLFMFGWVGNGK